MQVCLISRFLSLIDLTLSLFLKCLETNDFSIKILRMLNLHRSIFTTMHFALLFGTMLSRAETIFWRSYGFIFAYIMSDRSHSWNMQLGLRSDLRMISDRSDATTDAWHHLVIRLNCSSKCLLLISKSTLGIWYSELLLFVPLKKSISRDFNFARSHFAVGGQRVKRLSSHES